MGSESKAHEAEGGHFSLLLGYKIIYSLVVAQPI